MGGPEPDAPAEHAAVLQPVPVIEPLTVIQTVAFLLTSSHPPPASYIGRSGVLEKGFPAGGTLFHFPEVVDNRIVRLNGFWVSASTGL